MKITEAIFEGYVPSNLLAKDLGIESTDFKATTLNKISFKNVVLVKIPLSALKFITDKNYESCVLQKNEDTLQYDYILPISQKIRVGFWK